MTSRDRLNQHRKGLSLNASNTHPTYLKVAVAEMKRRLAINPGRKMKINLHKHEYN